MKYLSTLLPLLALGLASAAEVLVGNTATPDPEKARQPNMTVGVDFIDAVPEFGIKAVNGVPTRINLHVVNFEEGNIGIQSIRGSLWSIEKGIAIKNLTSLKVLTVVSKDQPIDLPYQFTTEMHPQDLILNLAMVVKTPEGRLVTLTAYNQTISIVEAPTSLLDPQILFLYLLLAAGFGGSAYFVYNTWLATVIPKTKRTNTDQVHLVRTTPVPTTAPGTYDESWIPEHHIKKPATVRARSGTPKGVKSRKGTE